MIKNRLLLATEICILVCFGNVSAIPNPSAAYCEKLGYQVIVRQDVNGNENGYCILPNGEEVNTWQFYRGEVAKEYSYCVKKGYDLIIDSIKHGDYIEECPFCVEKPTSTGSKQILKRIPQRDLMNQNGDSLFQGNSYEFIKPSPNPNLAKQSNTNVTLALPETFDWRSYNGTTSYITPIRDQLNCGICWAFAGCAAAEGVYNIVNGTSNPDNHKWLSPQFVFSCLAPLYPNYFGTTCTGPGSGGDGNCVAYVFTIDGAVLEDDFPYTGGVAFCGRHMTNSRIIFSHWAPLTDISHCPDTTAIKNAIFQNGPVPAFVRASVAFQNFHGGSIWDDTYNDCAYMTTPAAECHYLCLIGWGHSNQRLYWFVKNSWGNRWGDNNSGFGRIYWNAAYSSAYVSTVYNDNYNIASNTTINSDQTRIYASKTTISIGQNYIVAGNGSTGANVTMKAGNSITIGTGFRLQACGKVTMATFDRSGMPAKLNINPNGPQGSPDTLSQTKELSADFCLSQNSPNPFNPTTQINFTTPAYKGVSQAFEIQLSILDIRGRVVKRLFSDVVESGTHTVVWDGLSDNGSKVPSGVYICRLTSSQFAGYKKMILRK